MCPYIRHAHIRLYIRDVLYIYTQIHRVWSEHCDGREYVGSGCSYEWEFGMCAMCNAFCPCFHIG